MWPLVQKRILLLAWRIDHVGRYCPARWILQPSLAPLIITRPVGRFARFPLRKRTIVEHDGLPDIVAPPNVVGARVRNAKVSACQFVKRRNRSNWRAVVMNCHAIAPAKDPTGAILSASRASLRGGAMEEISRDRIGESARSRKNGRVASISLEKTAPCAAGQLALPNSRA